MVVIAYEKWAFMRGSKYVYKALTKTCLVFLIGDHLWEDAVYKSWFHQRFRAEIWNLSSSVHIDISLVRCAHSFDIDVNTRR